MNVLRRYRVRFDTDHIAIQRPVRSKWADWRPGSMVEVDIGTSDYGFERWIQAAHRTTLAQYAMGHAVRLATYKGLTACFGACRDRHFDVLSQHRRVIG